MRKLSKMTSMITAIFMLPSVFASDQSGIDETIVHNANLYRAKGMSDEEIAIMLSQQNHNDSQCSSVNNPAAPSDINSATLSTSASSAPKSELYIEESLPYIYVTMSQIRDSQDLTSKYDRSMDSLLHDFENTTAVKNSKYGLMPHLNKPENRPMRFNPRAWQNFSQKPQVFATDIEDAQIVSGSQQGHIMQCLVFYQCLSDHNFKITELEDIADQEPMKEKKTLLNALVNRDAQIGNVGAGISTFKNMKNWF